ncbi:unnamed protein product [Protopolystoma xenopodis]|uniref:Uncharacterized protein n=1 Tax=Protopolystoma xenopodis TaxID=117903 RepID=A0A3S5CIW3_9PLAT|nr:unnamed protein product [Protopolystoma xenopodis]
MLSEGLDGDAVDDSLASVVAFSPHLQLHFQSSLEVPSSRRCLTPFAAKVRNGRTKKEEIPLGAQLLSRAGGVAFMRERLAGVCAFTGRRSVVEERTKTERPDGFVGSSYNLNKLRT